MLGKATTTDPTASLVAPPIKKKFTNHSNSYAVLLKLPVILSHGESSLASTLRSATESNAINLLITTTVTHITNLIIFCNSQ